MNRFVIIKSENNYELENKVNEFLRILLNSRDFSREMKAINNN